MSFSEFESIDEAADLTLIRQFDVLTANEGVAMVDLTIQERCTAMNAIANIRQQHFAYDDTERMTQLFTALRDVSVQECQQNTRVLNAIMHLAGISRDRFNVDYQELTTEEKNNFRREFNRIRAVINYV